MMNYFNKEEFKQNYSKTMKQLDNVQEIAKIISKRKIEKIFLVGSGGAYTKFVNLRPMLFEKLNKPFIITSPEELGSLYHNQISNESLIIAGTKTGETLELIDALRKVKETCPQSIILGFIGDDDTKLDQTNVCDYRISSIDTDVHLILFGWFLLSYTHSNSDELNKWSKELSMLGDSITSVLASMEGPAVETISKVDTTQMQMWVGSGRLWGEICCYCNYILEEIQWIPAQGIHSSEFFHGPFELVTEDFNVNVVLNDDENRKQDIRVLNFVKKYTSNYSVIDMREYKMNTVNPELSKFIEPYILNLHFDTMLKIYTKKTGKSSKTRRYYRVTEY